MPTTAETVAAINHALGISNAGLWASRLRATGKIQSTQGVPVDLPPKDVCKIILGVMIGFAATKNVDLIDEYYTLLDENGNQFGDAVLSFLDKPHDLYEVAASNAKPAARVTWRGEDRSTQSATFLGPVVASPGFARTTTIDADAWQRLATALKVPIPAKRRRRRKFKQ